MKKQLIPIFYACDERYAPCAAVSIASVFDNASDENEYIVHVLNTDLTPDTEAALRALEEKNKRICFSDVRNLLYPFESLLPLRDRFSDATYFRLFIAEMFPEYDKAIYLDADTVVTSDVAELYATDLGDALVGACREAVMCEVPELGEYSESVLGIDRRLYFNPGVMLINCRGWRSRKVLDRFSRLVRFARLTLTQDGGYLNLICKDHVKFLDREWNAQLGASSSDDSANGAKILHFCMVEAKPWHNCGYTGADVFWKYAEKTAMHGRLRAVLENYTDGERERDREACEHLKALAKEEIASEDNYLRRLAATRDPGRVAIVDKIAEFERDGRFFEDVEDDPPGRMLMPDEIDYLRRGFIQKIKTRLAFGAARKFLYSLLEEKKMIVKEIRGIENMRDLESGAVITCNHFNAFDSFAIQIVYEASEQRHRTFWRVIREGNYTSFPGFYGRLMRNCNTLPLSSNQKTMRKFVDGVGTHLRNGDFVLIYPEQSMWWNYRKPKPLRDGAYYFASRNGVPVLPCFITMRNSDIIGEDGFPVQEYTIHVGKPIYPDEQKAHRDNVREMMDENARVWREIYEEEYGLPLSYS